jgi:hypothetical protein
MIYAFKERIGSPSLFCGRKKSMTLLMNWVEMIPREMAKSRALLGRRKCGKSAVMQRLFNILWNQHGQVIPLYFEVQDNDQWELDFAEDYFRTFMSQYLSFKTRTVLSLNNKPWQFHELIEMATEMGDENVLRHIDFFREDLEKERVGQAINLAFHVPSIIAGPETFVLVMIDEIQYMTKHIFYDKNKEKVAYNLPGAYHGLVESKVTPMLVSGSYIGWMTQMMQDMFKGGRLKRTPIASKLTSEEGLEAVYRYAQYNNKEVSDEVALVINRLTQSDPFYIASLFRSDWEEQDFITVAGVVNTLTYEIKDREGELFGTWSEYIYATIKEVNDQYAKKIILFLSKERYKECTRDQISEHLGGKLSAGALEEKLRTLKYGDLITQGINNFRYSGIPDDILDLIFRELYQEEIENDKPDIASDLANKVKDLERDQKSLVGKLRELKGRMLELMVYRELNQCRKKRQPLKNLKQRLRPLLQPSPQLEEILTACSGSPFETIWMNYPLQLPSTTNIEIDVLAIGKDKEHCWALLFETKNRDSKNLPTKVEAELFVTKVSLVKQWLATSQKVRFVCPLYLSAEGFDNSVETWLHEHGVLTTDMAHWEPVK